LRVKNDLTDAEIRNIEGEIFKQLGHYKGKKFKVYLINNEIFKEYIPKKAKQD
jgi:hypothetical protein